MLTMFAQKMQATVESYLRYTGSIIRQHMNYVNHVNKENIFTFWFIYLEEENNHNGKNVCTSILTSHVTIFEVPFLLTIHSF